MQCSAVRWCEWMRRRVQEGQSGEERRALLIETKVWTRGHLLSAQREELCWHTADDWNKRKHYWDTWGWQGYDPLTQMEDSLRRWWFGTSNCTIGTNVFSTSQPKTLWQDECTNLFRSVSKILKAGRIISSCLCNLNIFRWWWYDDHGEDRAGRSRGLDVSTFGPLATFGTRCLATLMMIMLMIMVCGGYTNGGYTYR